MAVKGFYDNPQEATTPASTDLLGIQQGDTLADMKKITYENLVKPLEEAKLDKIATPVENAIVVQNADGTLKNSNVNITDPTFDSVGADEFDTGSQVVEAAMIPSTTDEMLRLKNTQAGKVHTIMELRSPDTGDTEATLSLHTVPNGIDDWVFDLSFHNYSTFMKMVSVISHFTGENAGSWEWVSRYTDGTDYSMIERMLMKLDGQTGYLMVGENGDATARFHAKQVGYLDKPAIKAEVDSTHETQPPALHATDTTNHAQTGVLVKFSMLNATDTGVVLKLENAGTGAYINADDKFVVDKDGNITSPTINAIKGTGYTEGSLKTHEDRFKTLEGTGEGSVAKAIDDAVSPLAEVVDTNRLYSDSQYLDLKAKYEAQQIALNASKAELYTDDPILQYGAVEIIGKGYEADDTPIDVSANVVDGSLEMEQKGLTIRNLVTNGDFSQGTTGFSSTNAGTPSVSDGVLSFTATATSGTIFTSQGIIRKSGNKYFISIWVKSTSNGVALYSQGGVIAGSNNHSGSGSWELLRAIFTAPSDDANWNIGVIDTRVSGWTEVQVKLVATYNLTTLGLDHITDTDILSKLLPYVDGTKNVGKMGLRVVGKNLWDAKKRFSDLVTAWAIPWGASIVNDNGRTCLKITYFSAYDSIPLYQYPFIIGQQYTLKFQAKKITALAGIGVQIVHTDGTSIAKYPITTEYTSYTVTSTAGKTVSRIEFTLADAGHILIDLDTIQLELGSTATPYEPYQEQLIFLPAIGNSLPNGVADSIKTVADGWEHTKRVERVDMSTLNWQVYALVETADYWGVRIVKANEPDLVDFRTEIGGNLLIANAFTTYPLLDTWSNSFATYKLNNDDNLGYADDIYLQFKIPKSEIVGTIDTAKAKAYFETHDAELCWVLQTPSSTNYDLPLPTSGKTIHRFAGEEKIALYGTGLTFSENVLSVLSAVKFVAGVMTDITSLATITTNTVTFSGVGATDVVYVKVEHDVDRPLGILEHTPAVSNTASRLAAIEAWIAAQGA